MNRTGSAFAVFRYRYQILAHLDFRQIARYGVYVFKYKAYQRIFFAHHARQRIALARHVEHHPFAHARRQCAQQQRRYNQILFHLSLFLLGLRKDMDYCSMLFKNRFVRTSSGFVCPRWASFGFYVVSLTETIISRHALYLHRVRSVDRRAETAPHRKGHFRRGRSHFHSAAVLHGLRQGVARQFVRHRRPDHRPHQGRVQRAQISERLSTRSQALSASFLNPLGRPLNTERAATPCGPSVLSFASFSYFAFFLS